MCWHGTALGRVFRIFPGRIERIEAPEVRQSLDHRPAPLICVNVAESNIWNKPLNRVRLRRNVEEISSHPNAERQRIWLRVNSAYSTWSATRRRLLLESDLKVDYRPEADMLVRPNT